MSRLGEIRHRCEVVAHMLLGDREAQKLTHGDVPYLLALVDEAREIIEEASIQIEGEWGSCRGLAEMLRDDDGDRAIEWLRKVSG